MSYGCIWYAEPPATLSLLSSLAIPCAALIHNLIVRAELVTVTRVD